MQFYFHNTPAMQIRIFTNWESLVKSFDKLFFPKFGSEYLSPEILDFKVQSGYFNFPVVYLKHSCPGYGNFYLQLLSPWWVV